LQRNHLHGFRWQNLEDACKIDSAFGAEQVADGVGLQSIAVDARVDAVLERGAQVTQGQVSEARPGAPNHFGLIR